MTTGQIVMLIDGADDHLARAREKFPAHHRKRYALMLNDACTDLRRRGIDPAEMTALEVFSQRASERSKERLTRRGEKMVRARRAKAKLRQTKMKILGLSDMRQAGRAEHPFVAQAPEGNPLPTQRSSTENHEVRR